MIVIIDYGMGNLGSVANMLKKIGAQAVISSNIQMISRADKLILPGVGAFDSGMKNLDELGIIPVLNHKIIVEKTPLLGVCLGMQLLTRRSEEGQLPGLGWLDAETVRFKFDISNPHLKVPHMGWNSLQLSRSHPIFSDFDSEPRFYFVHSYYVVCADTRNILARTNYGGEFVSIVGKENILGVQFHPEKSHKFGMKLLRNFVEWHQ
jgi:glutamine amidotransferase